MLAKRRYFFIAALAYIVASYCFVFLNRDTLDSIARNENGYFQLAGAFAFLAAAALCVAAFFRSGHDRARSSHTRLTRLSYLILALIFILAGGEELSWGQHLIGFGTPEAVRQANVQQETTIHNLNLFGRANVNPLDRLFSAFWIAFVLLAPLAALASRSAHRLLSRTLPLVPLTIGLLFALNYAVSKISAALAESGKNHSIVEIKESNFGLLFLAIALYLVIVRTEPRTARALSGHGQERFALPRRGLHRSRSSRA